MKNHKAEPTEGDSKVRIIMDLDPEAAIRLDEIAKGLKLKRRTDVIRYALGLLGLFEENRSKGYEILFRKGQETIKVVVPSLR